MIEAINHPPKEIVKTIMQMMEERNININPQKIEITLGMMCHWLISEPRGKEYMAHALGLDVTKGTHDKKYKLVDHFEGLTHTIDPENIVFLRGCLAEGNPVSISDILIMDKEVKVCDSCGGSTICITDTVSGITGECQELCSNCMSLDDDMSLRTQITTECFDCTYSSCTWYPKENQKCL